ncbi:PRC-barrel domain-containing protein [Sulfitobacter guttiformis]|uniref:PRC-barrel domain protein n=1 Tax=Sulfitobacter guttiformis TaxID=74349 RepID=A0A420DU52_9RHOB|nr:PRC-barrel domain-containing protein [Sulfitobacter guttiformis]RKE97816.1 PRC-barrel domain protein [Sulfitobacter guttiformis]
MKKFLTSTAVILAMTAPAFAESHSAATTDTDAAVSTDTNAATADTNVATTSDTNVVTTDMNMEIGSVMAQPTDLFASNLIGMRIYSVEADMDYNAEVADGAETEWDDLGEINDIIVTADGRVSAVILGIGGFLGIGERDVSVPMGAINFVQEEGDSDDYFLVVKSSKEQLEAAPAFERDAM